MAPSTRTRRLHPATQALLRAHALQHAEPLPPPLPPPEPFQLPVPVPSPLAGPGPTGLLPGLGGWALPEGEPEVVVIDTETTACWEQRLVEIAAVHARGSTVLGQYVTLVNPGKKISPMGIKVHGITDAMVAKAPPPAEALAGLLSFVGALPLVAHNASFDRKVLASELDRAGMSRPGVPVYCTLKLARRVLTQAPNHRLTTLATWLALEDVPVHRALADARAALGVLLACLARRPGEPLATLHGPAHEL